MRNNTLYDDLVAQWAAEQAAEAASDESTKSSRETGDDNESHRSKTAPEG